MRISYDAGEADNARRDLMQSAMIHVVPAVPRFSWIPRLILPDKARAPAHDTRTGIFSRCSKAPHATRTWQEEERFIALLRRLIRFHRSWVPADGDCDVKRGPLNRLLGR